MKWFLIGCVTVLCGCQSTGDYDGAYLDVNGGARVVDAVVDNPYPECDRDIEVARLDSKADFRVFIDERKGGALCK